MADTNMVPALLLDDFAEDDLSGQILQISAFLRSTGSTDIAKRYIIIICCASMLKIRIAKHKRASSPKVLYMSPFQYVQKYQ